MSRYDDPDYIAYRKAQADAGWRIVARRRLMAAVTAADSAVIEELLRDGALDPRDAAVTIACGVREAERILGNALAGRLSEAVSA